MKQILLVDRFFFPDEQPTAVYLTELTIGLKGQFQFDVLCGPPLVTQETNSVNPPPARVFQVPCFKFSKRFLFSRSLNDLSFLFSVFLRGLFLPRPDLVLSQTSPPGVWWIGFLLSRWHRARWVHVFQDIFPDNLIALRGGKKGILFSCLDLIGNFPLRQADRMLTVGEDMKNRLVKKGLPVEKIAQIHNWVDLNFIRPLPKKNSFSERHQFVDSFVVLYAGNLGRVHNFEDLLGVAERLKSHVKIRFVLVGEGAMKGNLQRECVRRELPNVTLLPFEPRSRLSEVLATADVSVILLRKGMAGLSVPSKIYSIFASGRPVLACVENESDVASLVRESNSGFVIPHGKVDEWVERIKSLFENPGLKEKLGQNARRFAEEKDFQKKAFQNYENVFSSLLDRKNKVEAPF